MKIFKADSNLMALILLAGVALACVNGSNSGNWLPGSSTTDGLPTVTGVVPAISADSVAINSKVTATFSESMDPLTITTTTFELATSAGALVPGTVTYVVASRVATFTPDTNLAPSAVYTARVTTGVMDLEGYSMANIFEWSFTTGLGVDTIAPRVIATINDDGDTNVPQNTQVGATFSKAMDPTTLTTTTFTLTKAGVSVAGVVTCIGANALFVPDTNLSPNTLYVATITTGAKDIAGNPMDALHTWSWTTGSGPDIIAPTVTFIVPADSVTGVSIGIQAISATFSEAMDPFTITNLTFTVKDSTGVAVPGVMAYDLILLSHIATFRPTDTLASNSIYTAAIETTVKDLAGNALATRFVWTFKTAAAADVVAPTIIAHINQNGDTNVRINTQIGVTFSESMDPTTLTPLTFTLKRGLITETGTVSYAGVNALYVPDTYLQMNTLYTVTVKTGAKDIAGNALAADSTWSWTTGGELDTIIPFVTLVTPLNDTTGVKVNKTVSATFSEAMDPATITNLTFTLKETLSGNSVAGTILYDQILLSKIVTYSPTADLLPNTQYTATLTTAVSDLGGNGLATDSTWRFTTGTESAPEAMALQTAAPFGFFGGSAGLINKGLLTHIYGDMGTTGVSTTVTGFRDSVGDIYTITPLHDGMVHGRIYTDAPPPGGAGVGGNASTMAIATQALSDANTAWVNLSPANMPGGIDPGAGQLGGLTLAPGIYKSASGSFLLTGSDLTLDAEGDPNAVFVFQMASSLTVGAPGAPRNIILMRGAQSKNIFWQVGSAATINEAGGGTMEGTIISSAATTISTIGNVAIVTLNGRALALNAGVTMTNTIINVPAP